MLELVDRHDSGSCIRKSVGVQISPRAPELVSISRSRDDWHGYGMAKVKRTIFVASLAMVLSACDRRAVPYGGVTQPKNAPAWTVTLDPNRAGTSSNQ